MSSSSDEKKTILAMPVIAASYIGPALAPNLDAAWDEAQLPLNRKVYQNGLLRGFGLFEKSAARLFKDEKNRNISGNGIREC
jgi:hypothetical protein